MPALSRALHTGHQPPRQAAEDQADHVADASPVMLALRFQTNRHEHYPDNPADKERCKLGQGLHDLSMVSAGPATIAHCDA